MRGTTAAQGDAIRTAGSFANQVKRLKASVIDAAAEIGGPLLDDLAGLVSIASSGITAFRNFASENTELFRTVGIVLATITGLGAALVGIGGALSVAGVAASGFAGAMGIAGGSVAFLVSPLAIAIGGVTALGVALVKYTDLGADAVDWLTERFGPLVETVMSAGAAVMDALKLGDTQAAWELAMSALELLWLDLSTEIQDIWANTMMAVMDLGSNMAQGLGMLFESLANALSSMLAKYERYYNKVYSTVLDLGEKVSGTRTIGERSNAFQSDFGGASSGITSALDQVRTFGQEMQKTAQSQRETRREERESSKEQRAERITTLRESVQKQESEIGVAKEKASRDSEALLKAAKDDVEKNQKQFGEAGTAIEQEKRNGPTGTFSAFAAGIVGGGPNRLEKINADQLEQLKRIQTNTRGGGARFA